MGDELRGENLVHEGLTDFCRDYFQNVITTQAVQVRCIIEFFAYYLHIPADMEQFSSLGEAYDYEKDVYKRQEQGLHPAHARGVCTKARRPKRDTVIPYEAIPAKRARLLSGHAAATGCRPCLLYTSRCV